MVKITVEYEDGRTVTTNDVLSYGFWDKETVQYFADEFFNDELTEDELKEFESYCDSADELPNGDDVRAIISEIISKR